MGKHTSHLPVICTFPAADDNSLPESDHPSASSPLFVLIIFQPTSFFHFLEYSKFVLISCSFRSSSLSLSQIFILHTFFDSCLLLRGLLLSVFAVSFSLSIKMKARTLPYSATYPKHLNQSLPHSRPSINIG